MAQRRYEDVSPLTDVLIDAVGGVTLMLIMHFAVGWAWWAAALLGFGGIGCLVFLLMYEDIGGSFFDDFDWPWD
jgi:hypothetical protein